MKTPIALLALLLVGAAKPVVYSEPCLLLGDSIALGLVPYKPQCAVAARPHSASSTLKSYVPRGKYPLVYISAGSNDPLNPKLAANLLTIRNKFRGSKVVWIAARNSRAQQRTYEVALQFKDKIVYTSKLKSKDGINPKSFKDLARSL